MTQIINLFFFFFQAEDGIRDYKVTGVQTCALPISRRSATGDPRTAGCGKKKTRQPTGSSHDAELSDLQAMARDRKSTRLNSSHLVISYAVFCLKKKNQNKPSPCLSHNSTGVQQCQH